MLQVDEDAWVSGQFVVIIPGDAQPLTRWPPLRQVAVYLGSFLLLYALVLSAAVLLAWMVEGVV